MFRAVTEWRTKPGDEDAFAAAWVDLVTWTNGLFFGRGAVLLRQREDPSHFLAIGTFPSDEVLGTWRDTPGLVERFEDLTRLAASYETRHYDQVVEVS